MDMALVPTAAQSDVRDAEQSSLAAPNWFTDWKVLSDLVLNNGFVEALKGKPHEGNGVDSTDGSALTCVPNVSMALIESHTLSQSLIPCFKDEPKDESHDEEPVSNNDNRLLNLPLELKLMIMEHLDPIDRIMLKFASRLLYVSLPTLPLPLGRYSCGKARMFLRLMESSLLPRFYELGELMDKDQIKEILRHHVLYSACELCRRYWVVSSPVQCPFHYQMNTETETSAFALSKLNAGIRAIMPRCFTPEPVTQEEFIKFVERSTTSSSLRRFRNFGFAFAKTWINQIELWEESGLYEPVDGRSQTWTLNCCNHCKNVLRSNSYYLGCGCCTCKECGWTPVQVLRVEADPDGEVMFIPLGRLKEGTVKSDLRMIKP
ncbi:hypothetical protein FQN54_006444 [Arachnomyces sp. PD_36]|nr:hypothetical protein FQN54_006444 [Arachnomyces sp. PD_36]